MNAPAGRHARPPLSTAQRARAAVGAVALLIFAVGFVPLLSLVWH